MLKLKQIKLSGFKSFVDPTVFDLRSNLVGIVGPNGCGKSNIVDAVWSVLGVNSKSVLRSQMITDLIFKGSNTRKPVGLASVEMIFDNSDGALGGAYAAYAEISIRREITRDAVSNYYLNGTRCRRRDIEDVFAGTGLGPRSYAIFSQGMVSDIVGSDDLRGFVEEAAGISFYKKRRHETELRMQHTTENLTRLEDLREEQVKLLERLKKQSESAQKFKTYSTEKDALEAQLLVMRWSALDNQLVTQAEQIRNLSLNLEEKLAERASLEAQIEADREEYQVKAELHEEVQSNYYSLGSSIARIEQSLQHLRERRQQLEQDLLQTNQSIEAIGAQKTTDNAELLECEELLAQITPDYERAQAVWEQAEELYQDAKIELDVANEEWERLQQDMLQPQQDAQVQKARIEQLERQARDMQARIERFQVEYQNLDVVPIEKSVVELSQQLLAAEKKNAELREQLVTTQNAIGAKRHELQQQQESINQVRSKLQQAKGVQASLQALQQAALGKDDVQLQQWLAGHALADMPRYAQQITVATSWELAVETVLADYLQAIYVSGGLDFAALADWTGSSVVLLDGSVNGEGVAVGVETLAQKVSGNDALQGVLQHVLIADDVATALQMRSSLQGQQSIITRDGKWFGANWLRVGSEQGAQQGILEREQRLQVLEAELELLLAQEGNCEERIAECNEQLRELELNLIEQQQAQTEVAAQLREMGTQCSVNKQKLEHMTQRRSRLNIEISELQQTMQQNGGESSASRVTLEAAIEAMANYTIRKEELVAKREQVSERERSLKQQVREAQDELHDLELNKRTISTKYAGLQHTISRVDQQLAELHKRRTQIESGLATDVVPVVDMQAELEVLLGQRITVEEQLQQAREQMELVDARVRGCEKQRQQLEISTQKIREVLEAARLEHQAVQVRRDTVQEQLQLLQLEVEKIVQEMPADAQDDVWVRRIDELQRKINNLGAINLAAMDELETESQRQEYLESQYNDLREALTTLDNAIKKIDRETRAKFQETFDTVNNNFMVLFPKLFGGGKACLELIGDDLLQARVTVMAQPPGKKNSSIHLLSGGEKALTAVSLVFAIFQLNPAPFCILDEVDAPLDESNVVRFGNLIKEMSEKVQFVFITHNKATMEIANQLVGVTMKEPGVSRLVSVDVSEAVELALA